jgi:hypothetical protein
VVPHLQEHQIRITLDQLELLPEELVVLVVLDHPLMGQVIQMVQVVELAVAQPHRADLVLMEQDQHLLMDKKITQQQNPVADLVTGYLTRYLTQKTIQVTEEVGGRETVELEQDLLSEQEILLL